MARIHSHRHGKSHQTRPTSKSPPAWTNVKPEEVKSTTLKLAKEGLTPSRIGMVLRDDHAVPLVKPITGKSVMEILLEGKSAPKLPQDLQDLIDRAKRVQNHLQVHGGDRKNVHSLELIEAKIYRLSKYYKDAGILPKDFKYNAVVAQLA